MSNPQEWQDPQREETRRPSYFDILKEKSGDLQNTPKEDDKDASTKNASSLLTEESVDKLHQLNIVTKPKPVGRSTSTSSETSNSRNLSRTSSVTKETSEISHDYDSPEEKLNQYTILKELGRGSFGVVKLVKDNNLNECFAMKIMSKKRLKKKSLVPGKAPSKSPLDGVKKEIAILKKLDHPNIVRLVEVLDANEEDNLYLVFELMDGGQVMNIEMEKVEPLLLEESRRYFIELVLGVEYLHYQHIIHRDIKPDNLLLTSKGQLKISDFGVSHIFEGDDDSLSATAGSPAFLSPEVISTDGSGYKGKGVDIWAMGVTLYCFVFGRCPFMSSNILELHDMILHQPLTFPDDIEISQELKDLLVRMLDKNSSSRITIEEIKIHPWVTKNNTVQLPLTQENCVLVEVSEKEVENAVRLIPRFSTIVRIQSMIHRASFSLHGNNRKKH